jgi:hypothetical protein
MQNSCAIFVLVGTLLLAGCGGNSPITALPAPTPQVPVGTFNNATQFENAKVGSSGWIIPTSQIATNHEIEGYASASSVNRGDSIQLFVNTAASLYRIEIWRLGWYNGAGGRLIATSMQSRTPQPACPTDPATLLTDCQWQSPYVLQIPPPASDPTSHWTSGIYVAKLTAGSGPKSSYITFTVRDDARKAQIRFELSTNTWEAYEDWGGHSLYSSPRAFKVSFNRPFQRGAGTGNMLASGWDIAALRFVEREGYDVTYAADLDAHLNAAELLNHKILFFPSHHEYWSTPMRNNVQAAIDTGVSAVFFGSNNVYWQVRFENDSAGVPDRVMVCYKSTADPIIATDPALTTVRFRDAPVNLPEEKMLGVMFNGNGLGFHSDVFVADATHWIFSGTGVHTGDDVGEYLGQEVDSQFGLHPANTVVLLNSPFTGVTGGSGTSQTVIYQAPSGSYVFSAGTSDFVLGLDNFQSLGANFAPQFFPPDSPTIQQMTRNLLSHLGATK